MPLLQIFVHRELSPQQGQEYLQRMIDEADQRSGKGAPGGGATHAVKVNNVSRWENPFPEVVQTAFEDRLKLQFDSVNLCYFFSFSTEHEAEKWRKWFDADMRPWIAANAPSFDVSKLHVRVMGEHETVSGAESY